MHLVCVEENTTADGLSLALVFTFVRGLRSLIHFAKHELANPSSGVDLEGNVIGIVELKGDLSLKSSVDPAGILDEKAHATNRAAAFDKRGEIRGEFDIFDRGCEQEGMGGDGHKVALDSVVFDLLVKGKEGVGVFCFEEMSPEPAIDGGGLNVPGFVRAEPQFSRLDEGVQGSVG